MDKLEERIERVENGLTPAVVIEGQVPEKWNLVDRMAHYRVPGVSVAVIKDHEIEWAKGYGVLEAGKAAPVTPETRFQAASISKPVSALGALSLVERGLIPLDEDVNARLVAWQVPENAFTQEKKVTLRGLLSHTAGLTVHGFMGYPAEAELPTLLQVLDGAPPANSDPIRVDVVPGSQFRYSGGGYCVMQQLCVDVTDRPFAELMQEAVLGPLGMAHSTFEQPLRETGGASAASAHRGYGQAIEGRWHVYPELAAAGLWTTPSDLARFALELSAHTGRSTKTVSNEMLKEMLRPQSEQSLPMQHPLSPTNVGLGIFLTDMGDAVYFSHGGSNEGFRCLLIAIRGGEQGAVIMTNSDQGDYLMGEVFQSLAAAYTWPRFAPLVKVEVELAPELLQAYVGEYELMPEVVISVALQEGKLVAQPPGPPGTLSLELHAESETQFFATEMLSPIRFVKDEAGQVTQAMLGESSAKKVA